MPSSLPTPGNARRPAGAPSVKVPLGSPMQDSGSTKAKHQKVPTGSAPLVTGKSMKPARRKM